MIYVIASALAIAIIGAGILVTRRSEREVADRFQQLKTEMKANKAAGILSPDMSDAEIDNLELRDVGMPMPSGLHTRVDLTRWMTSFWYVLIPLVLVMCLGGAFIVNRFVNPPRTELARP
jgi:hypothetical protein